MTEHTQDALIVRVPIDITQDEDGTIVVKAYRLISHPTARGSDLKMSADESAAFNDAMVDKITRWTPDNAEASRSIKRHADLYIWWNAFIEGPLGQVPIGSEQFRESRAGLIHPTFLNLIRRESGLTPADFKSLSLAEVFAVISDIHTAEHNRENRRKQAISEQDPSDCIGRKQDADRTQEKNSGKNLKTWDANCERMAKEFIRKCVTAGGEIPRLAFITEELRRNASKYPNAKAASTISKAFQLNKKSWKPALTKALADRTQSGRKK